MSNHNKAAKNHTSPQGMMIGFLQGFLTSAVWQKFQPHISRLLQPHMSRLLLENSSSQQQQQQQQLQLHQQEHGTNNGGGGSGGNTTMTMQEQWQFWKDMCRMHEENLQDVKDAHDRLLNQTELRLQDVHQHGQELKLVIANLNGWVERLGVAIFTVIVMLLLFAIVMICFVRVKYAKNQRMMNDANDKYHASLQEQNNKRIQELEQQLLQEREKNKTLLTTLKNQQQQTTPAPQPTPQATNIPNPHFVYAFPASMPYSSPTVIGVSG